MSSTTRSLRGSVGNPSVDPSILRRLVSQRRGSIQPAASNTITDFEDGHSREIALKQRLEADMIALLDRCVLRKTKIDSVDFQSQLRGTTTRTALYSAWCEIYTKELQHPGDAKLLKLLQWLLSTYPDNPLDQSLQAMVRLKIFATIQTSLIISRKPSLDLRKRCEQAMAMQSPLELFRTSALDMQFWLYKSRTNTFPTVAKSLETLPFEQPLPFLLDFISGLFDAIVSRTDAFIALVDVIVEMLAAKAKRFEKLLFLLHILNDKLRMTPPSAVLVTLLHRKLDRAGKSSDSDVTAELKSACDVMLKLIQAETGADGEYHNGPPLLVNAVVPSLPRPTSAHYRRQEFAFADPEAVVATIEDTILTVEELSSADRPALYSSKIPGVLAISRVGLSWQADDLPSFQLLFENVRQFCTGTTAIPGTHYISFLSQEHVRVHPFYDNEIGELTDALSDLLGIEPVTEAELLATLSKQKLSEIRTQTHQHLSEVGRWVDTASELSRLLRRMIMTNKPAATLDLELLFHSCRQNEEVAMEAINILRRLWYSTATDQLRQKVLQVVDRLIDPRVMPPTLPHLRLLLAFLHNVERTVDPYKSPGLVNQAVELRKRAENIRGEAVLPQLDGPDVRNELDQAEQYSAFYVQSSNPMS